jgi:PPK2 family polyphosphate:nucleotide phosphotransferase
VSVFEQFRVHPDRRIDLSKLDPAQTPGWKNKDEAAKQLDKDCAALTTLQYRLYAENKRSLLVVLQAMDTGGKDGTINHVFQALNPQSAYVRAFKQPSALEASHDFLWRAHAAAPAHGQMAIFNRSHYEDVLTVRVHDLVPEDVWSKRYDRINEFEKNLTEAGTTILKFFLHISPETQLARFRKRLDDPSRQWKISESDYGERKYWDDYIRAYEAVLERCSTAHAPWYVVPADKKWFRNLVVGGVMRHALEALDPKIPDPSVDLEQIRKQYHEAADGATQT